MHRLIYKGRSYVIKKVKRKEIKKGERERKERERKKRERKFKAKIQRDPNPL